MIGNAVVYVVEVIVLILVGLLVNKFFFRRKKKKFFKFLIGLFCIYVGVFIFTWCLEKPIIEISNFESIEAKSESNIVIPKTFYHFKDITDKVKVNSNVDTDKIGEYDVEFVIPTLFGEYKRSTKIKVIDTTPPEIELQGEEEIKLSYKKEYEEPGFKAIDLCDGDLTDKVETVKENENENEFIVIYKVKDLSQNEAQKTRHVTKIDDIAPVLTLNGSEYMYLKPNEEYKESGAKAVDEKDGDLTEKIQIEGKVDTSKEGEYVITYKASDSKGNEVVKKRKISVSNSEEVEKQVLQNAEKGVIYLTFDDGPTTSTTPKVLDLLSKRGIKATFFIINYDDEGEKLVKREHSEGHTVAIHGYSHKYEEIYQSIDTYMNNLTKLQEKIRNTLGGYNATITRFPGGSSNVISKRYSLGIMTALTHEVVNRGFTYFDWNVDSDDAGSAKTSDDVYRNVTNGLKKTRANVVLMHDFSGNNKTLNALDRIIDYGIDNGYTFKVITKDTPMVTHKPNN